MERGNDPPAPAGGCQDYRLGLVIAALERRLAQAADEEEAARLRAEIASLEKRLGL